MDRFSAYLEFVPLPVLLGAPAVAAIVFFLIPSRIRLQVSLIAMVLFLTMGRFPELGMVQIVAKATGFAAIIGVIVSAFLDPRPKMQLSQAVWVYPILAVLAFAYVISVVDLPLALVLRLQWLLMTIAAIAVARTIVDENSLVRVLGSLWIGLAIASLVAFAHLIVNPAEALRQGLGRFEPWGALSNHIGTVFSGLVPISLYLVVRSRTVFQKFILLGFAALGLGMAVMTGSRSTVITILLAIIPIAWYLRRKPVVAIVTSIILAAGVVYIVGKAEDTTALARYGSLETGRTTLAKEYLVEVIAKRPVFGLMGTRGESVLKEEEIADMHSHNAYLDVLYLGGISYGIPVFAVVVLTLVSVWKVYSARHMIPATPPLITYLCWQTVVVYLQGNVNGVIYHPTYTWAFLHLLLSVFMISAASRIKHRQPVLEDHTGAGGAEAYYNDEEYDVENGYHETGYEETEAAYR